MLQTSAQSVEECICDIKFSSGSEWTCFVNNISKICRMYLNILSILVSEVIPVAYPTNPKLNPKVLELFMAL